MLTSNILTMLALDISDLARKNKGPLPSCVYTKFLEQFASPDGIYAILNTPLVLLFSNGFRCLSVYFNLANSVLFS